MYKHRQQGTVYQEKMANPNFSFLQTIICGPSDHSEIALNQYLQETNADIAVLNETKTKLSAKVLTISQYSVV